MTYIPTCTYISAFCLAVNSRPVGTLFFGVVSVSLFLTHVFVRCVRFGKF